VPCVVKPPTHLLQDSQLPGSFNRAFTTVMDFVPTFLELANVELPRSEVQGLNATLTERKLQQPRARFRSRDVHVIRGKCIVPIFNNHNVAKRDEVWTIHPSTEPIGWELFTRAALRKGDWYYAHKSFVKGTHPLTVFIFSP
jgi:arylsulfatase